MGYENFSKSIICYFENVLTLEVHLLQTQANSTDMLSHSFGNEIYKLIHHLPPHAKNAHKNVFTIT